MVLAQDTRVMFLDEPTTYLDLAHSIEILNLVHSLSRNAGKTIVMVLHDLNLALRYSDHLLVMRDGQIAAAGQPREIVTPHLLEQTFSLAASVVTDPATGGLMIVPDAPTHSLGSTTLA